MKVVIPGGGGHLGRVLVPALAAAGHEVVVLSRGGHGAGARAVAWDGRTLGPWAKEVDGADAVVNLAGRSVDCRYTAANLRQMMDSRVESARAVGEAIAAAAKPPRVWLQSSTATIYAHRFDAANDEATGVLGGSEPGVPAYWRASIDIALAWERTLAAAPTPSTRRVAMRTSIVMSAQTGGAFAAFRMLARLRLGGALAGGRQFVSWIHERDFVRAVLWLLERDDLDGPVNLAAPAPLPQREFARALRAACGVRVGLPAAGWMLEAGAFVLRTETELLLKSRRVVPARLLASGFAFDFPAWPEAARDLVDRFPSPRLAGADAAA
jgi:uncharacterized protein (TIGR01777 family)